jgi:hypothetical protein
MHPFEEYLKQHHLEALAVSIKAQVRYVTVWNAVKGNPITEDHAQKIRQAVVNLTGIPYTGPFALLQEQTQNRPVNKRIPKSAQ